MTGALERKEDGNLMINHQVIDFYFASMYEFCINEEEADILKYVFMMSNHKGYDEFCKQDDVKEHEV